MRIDTTTHRRTARVPKDANCTLSPDLTSRLTSDLFKALDLHGFKDNYLATEVLSKFLDRNETTDGGNRERAIEKWLACEKKNAATNDRLSYISPVTLGGISLSRIVGAVRKVISDVLGDTIPTDALIGRFSGGASTSRNRLNSLAGMKYTGQADITAACLPWLKLALEDSVLSKDRDIIDNGCPGWDPFLIDINIVDGNELFTVPKKSDIDRVCCKEPDLNMWMQKAAGDYIRKQLRKVGIDLNDQERNKSLAYEGSKSGLIATLDLSSASDSVTTGLCELVLPFLWFDYLSDLRSPCTKVRGEYHTNEMFSSMGNGFTFELESLLFFAIVRSVHMLKKASGPISIYGDDIICPTSIADEVTEVLEYFGFSLNLDKSFTSGPFRESCGGHYCNGVDVSPFYIRGPIARLTDLINVLNKIRKWSDTGYGLLDHTLEEVWVKYAKLVPNELKGGFDYERDTLLVSPDPLCKQLVRRNVDVRVSSDGEYVWWLNTTWGRQSPISVSVPKGACPKWLHTYVPLRQEAVTVSGSQRALAECRARRIGTSVEGGLARRINVFACEL